MRTHCYYLLFVFDVFPPLGGGGGTMGFFVLVGIGGGGVGALAFLGVGG